MNKNNLNIWIFKDISDMKSKSIHAYYSLDSTCRDSTNRTLKTLKKKVKGV